MFTSLPLLPQNNVEFRSTLRINHGRIKHCFQNKMFLTFQIHWKLDLNLHQVQYIHSINIIAIIRLWYIELCINSIGWGAVCQVLFFLGVEFLNFCSALATAPAETSAQAKEASNSTEFFVLLVEAKTQLGFRYASIFTRFFAFCFYNHNSWVFSLDHRLVWLGFHCLL